MTELIDVLNPAGLRTGEILTRSEIHRLGKHHRAIHLYIFNKHGEVLLQRRSMSVDHYPGMFGISITGHIPAGESSSDAVGREVREEIGLDPTELQIKFIFSYYQEAKLSPTYIDRQFNDVYIARGDIAAEALKPNWTEVTEVKYVPFAKFKDMVERQSGGLAPVYSAECRDLVYFIDHEV